MVLAGGVCTGLPGVRSTPLETCYDRRLRGPLCHRVSVNYRKETERSVKKDTIVRETRGIYEFRKMRVFVAVVNIYGVFCIPPRQSKTRKGRARKGRAGQGGARVTASSSCRNTRGMRSYLPCPAPSSPSPPLSSQGQGDR